MLSYDFWKQRFGGDPQIVGKTVLVNNHQMTIIGVAQAGFDGAELGYSTKIFVPVMMGQQIIVGPMKRLTDRRSRWGDAFGRLKAGGPPEEAEAVGGGVGTAVGVLMATRGMVVVVGWANIGNLLLARATGRQKEIAVRLAMGATRGRIVAQLLIETLSLSALGGILGLVLAFWGDKALMAIYLPSESNALNISTAPDLRILFFTLAVHL